MTFGGAYPAIRLCIRSTVVVALYLRVKRAW